jgi:DNA-binding LacI/PurR family transcriptional regulator
MRSSTPTMRDVAKAAGVSIQTVSAIINEKPGITHETKERVLNAIQTLGYRPFSVARSLRTRRTHTLGLVVSDINNPVFSTLASIIEDAVHLTGYSLVVYNTHNDPHREQSCINAITQRWIDGVFFVSIGDDPTGLEMLKSAGIPVVAIDRIPAGYEGAGVALDNRKAGVMAANHLVELGHRKVAHIRGPEHLQLAREREIGFRSVLEISGIEMLCPGSEARDWFCEAGYQGMLEILRCAPDLTALFAASDRLAIGAMRAITEQGKMVPEDISVIGVDDIEVSAYQNPPLTTIRQSFEDLGLKAVSILFEIINGAMDKDQRVMIEPELVVRESTRKLN